MPSNNPVEKQLPLVIRIPQVMRITDTIRTPQVTRITDTIRIPQVVRIAVPEKD